MRSILIQTYTSSIMHGLFEASEGFFPLPTKSKLMYSFFINHFANDIYRGDNDFVCLLSPSISWSNMIKGRYLHSEVVSWASCPLFKYDLDLMER